MLNKGYIFKDTVSAASGGWAVLRFYHEHYPRLTEGEWEQRILAGAVTSGGVALVPGDILRPGMELRYFREPWEEPEVPREVSVLLEEKGLIVFDKPSGLPVLPGGGFLENTLLHIVRSRFGDALSPLHRLGRGTSGAILFTRTADAAAALSRAMREHRVHKTYLALAAGTSMPDSFTVDQAIGPVTHPLLGTVHAACDDGKPSVSHCRVLERRTSEGVSLLAVDIPTGRPHQIRIHLAAAGCPLAGDPMYAPGGGLRSDTDRPAVPGDCGYHLHSWKLRFPDPHSGSERTVAAPVPDVLRLPSR
jgi:23S rRNA pseudouridine1911/1915/1917 synthase